MTLHHNDPRLRRSGRTRLMLDIVEDHIKKGGKAIVLLANHQQLRHLHDFEIAYRPPLKRAVEEQTLLLKVPDQSLNWTHLSFGEGYSEFKTFVDHHTIERYLSRALAELHAYDPEPDKLLDNGVPGT